MKEKHKISTIVTCHANADWDSFSATVGLSLLYPNSAIIFPGSMDKAITQFFQEHKNMYPFMALSELTISKITQVVIADTQQPSRLPHIKNFFNKNYIQFIIWDHHPIPAENDHIANCTFNIKHYGSTCTLVVEALQKAQVILSNTTATLLGTGIYADTGGLTYISTTQQDYVASSWLLQQGMDLKKVSSYIKQEMTAEQVKILGSLLESIIVHEIGNYRVGIIDFFIEGFLGNFSFFVQHILKMEEYHALFALASMEDKVHVIARSTTTELNVGTICKSLGGGGHPYAASASIKGKTLPDIKESIFQRLYKQINSSKHAETLMSFPVIGIEQQTLLSDAEHIMNRYGLKAVPVFQTNTRHCLGYIEAQTVSKATTHGLGSIQVIEYTQKNMITATLDTPLHELVNIIIGSRQRLVPVIENDTVLGIITRTDLIESFVETASTPIPIQNNRIQYIEKLLSSRISSGLYTLLKDIGALGDLLQVNVYIVGGVVRDLLLNNVTTQQPIDIDLVIEGDGIAFAKALAAQVEGRVYIYSKFMTSSVLIPGATKAEQDLRIDIASARLEYYKQPGATPTVEPSSIKMDLFRRDFTINAMAVQINTSSFGALVDFFSGQQDVKNKLIQVIHTLSFVEDPTRIIRAIRFEQRYKFQISKQSEKLIKNALSLDLLKKTSSSRLLHELTLIFKEQAPQLCLIRMDELGILESIDTNLALTPNRKQLLQSIQHILEWYELLYIKNTPSPRKELLYLLGLCRLCTQQQSQEILNKLGIPNTIQKTILATRKNIKVTLKQLSSFFRIKNTLNTISKLHELLSPLSLEGLLYCMACAPNEQVMSALSLFIYKWRFVKPDVTGKDLKNLGLNPGPQYTEILADLLNKKLNGHLQTKKEQLDYIHKKYIIPYLHIHKMP